MKLGSAHQNGHQPPRAPDPALLVPPSYRLVGRRPTIVLSSGGCVRECWQAECPGGLPVSLTIYRTNHGHDAPAEASTGLPSPELLLSARHPHIAPALAAWSSEDATVLVSAAPGQDLWDLYLQAREDGADGLEAGPLLEYLTEAAKAVDDLAARPGFLGHGQPVPQMLHVEGGSVLLERPQPLDWETPAWSCEHGFVYMAPGRAANESDRRAATRAQDDQFGLAAIYVHLRTGHSPFDPIEAVPSSSGGASSLSEQLARRALHLPRLLGAERRVLERALAVEPSDRYARCRDLVEALRRSRRSRRGATRPAERPARVGPAFLGSKLPLTSTVDASGAPGDALGRVEHEAGLAAPWLDPSTVATGVRRLRTRSKTAGAGPNQAAAAAPRPGRRVGGMAPRTLLTPQGAPAEPPSGEVAMMAQPVPGSSDSGLASAVDASAAASTVAKPGAEVIDDARARRAAALRREGEWHLSGRRHRDALDAYTRALAFAPGDPAALHGRALAYFGLRALAEAQADLDATLDACPRDASARNNRGLVRLALGDPQGAFDDFRRAALDDPSLTVVHYNMGRALGLLSSPAESLDHYDRAIALDPGFVKAYRARAAARARVGDADGALADFDHALSLKPDDGLARHQRGLVRFACGDLAGTAIDFEAAVRLQPYQAAVWYDLGRVRLALGEFDRAIEAFDESLRRDPGSTRAERLRLEAETRRDHAARSQLDDATIARPSDATLGSAVAVADRTR